LLNKIVTEKDFEKKKESVKFFFENLKIWDKEKEIKFKPCSDPPFKLLNKPYCKNNVLLPFKDD
jgi:hypothetical protein